VDTQTPIFNRSRRFPIRIVFATMNDTAVLLIDCPDRKGLVSSVSGLLYKYGANITHADQHQDHEEQLFFMRIQWVLEGFDLSAFEAEFRAVAVGFQMRWSISLMSRRPRIALFVSRALHCLADILHRWQSGELRCSIPLVVSNHPEAESLARFYGMEFYHISVTPETRMAAEDAQLKLMRAHEIDYVVLARYMQILSPTFVRQYAMRIINVHHSFLPAFIGAKPYHAAFRRGVKLIGATSHFVTETLDEGPIIEQDVVRISHRDQVEDLIQKGRDLERIVLSRAVLWHLENRILCYGNKTVVFD
jgi:formyltetrahydrofolate deformylase